MFGFLSKIKSASNYILLFFLITSVFVCFFLKVKNAENEEIILQQNKTIAECQAKKDVLESQVRRWKYDAMKTKKRIIKKDALILKKSAETQKKIKVLSQIQYPQDCNDSIKKALNFIN